MRSLIFLSILAIAGCIGTASAEQYIIKTSESSYQSSQFKVILNGQTIALYRDAAAQADITRFVKPGKNSLTLEVLPGKNTNSPSEVAFTLGAGEGSKWRTLYKYVVGKETRAGQVRFVFIAKPSPTAKPGKISLFTDFSSYQPVQFDVMLNSEAVSSMNSDGNLDLTPFLHQGKNVVTIKYIPGKNTNSGSHSYVTIGEENGKGWNNLLRFGVGVDDKGPGTISFPIYR